jgi:hypothetical protein
MSRAEFFKYLGPTPLFLIFISQIVGIETCLFWSCIDVTVLGLKSAELGIVPFSPMGPLPKGRFAWTNHIYFQKTQPSSSTVTRKSRDFFFVDIFWRARVCRPLLRLCRPFMIFEGCLDSNPECCRSKQAHYRLSHPSLYLATHPSS